MHRDTGQPVVRALGHRRATVGSAVESVERAERGERVERDDQDAPGGPVTD